MRYPLTSVLKAILSVLVLHGCGQDIIHERVHQSPAKYVDLPFSFGEVLQTQEQEGLCPVRISFGSDCCGVDEKLRRRFDASLAEDARVVTVYTQGWGREGEIDYCLEIALVEDREPVLRKVQGILNSYGEPHRGYVHILRSVN